MHPSPEGARIAAVAVRETGEAIAFAQGLRGWLAVAIVSLGIAGAFALLLAVSRVPGSERIIPWPVDFFHKGLVIHVVLSFIVWFLACLGALAHVATHAVSPLAPRLDALGSLAVGGTAAALPLLFVPALLDRGEATLNNYVPVIIDPLYYLGLVVLAVSVGLAVLRFLVHLRPAALRRNRLAVIVLAAALGYGLALTCFAMAALALAGAPLSAAFNEELMWGGGHILQFVNTLLLIAAWALLARSLRRTVGSAIDTRWTTGATVALILSAALGPLFYLVFPMFSVEQARGFTLLQYILGPAALIAALGIVPRLPRPLPWRDPAFLALGLSMLVFAVGGFLGLFVDGGDTRTPAHYHGVIAGVTLAWMGLFLTVLLPMLGRPVAHLRRVRVMLHLFAWGQLAACLGLFVAGGHGAPRKVAGAAQGLEGLAAMIGMAVNGLGGLVAVIGGVVFVWTVGVALVRPATEKSQGIERLFTV